MQIFRIPHSTLDGLLMIPQTAIYDDYIDQPKLSEQKNTVEYIVPPLNKSGSEQLLYTKINSTLLQLS